MISETFVHIMLPGETSFVTAGRFVLTEDRHGAHSVTLYMVVAISHAPSTSPRRAGLYYGT